MKIHFLAFAAGLFATMSAPAAFEVWTSKDGRTAELEFVGKAEKDGEPAAEFRLRSGQKTVLKVSDLDDAGKAKFETLLAAAPAASAATVQGGKSVFDEVLENKLVRLNGSSVKKADDVAKPTKYYVFYYSAKWCGPCQAYTPSLVNLYNKIKPGNPKFELVFVSSDQDDNSMEEYMKDKKMPWPALKLSAVEKFRREFDHGVRGIPSVVVCDLEGKIVVKTNGTAELEKLLTE
ncbi:MAG: thioredoxin-like domain-containing protein [Verrucomicrobiales bacterium]